MRNKKFGNSTGKGYYIALILCAVAIGISGYLYYANQKEDSPQPGGQDITVQATDPIEKDMPVAATVPDPYTETQTPIQSTEPAPTVVTKPIRTGSPLEGQVVAAYAMDALGYNPTTRDWRTHDGVDLAAEAGAPVLAAADGKVYTVYEDEMMGHTVVIRHQDGYVTCYASLGEDIAVAPGDTVTLGQKIGTVGNSALLESALGDHIHFSVTQNDKPIDPQKFLAGE